MGRLLREGWLLMDKVAVVVGPLMEAVGRMEQEAGFDSCGLREVVFVLCRSVLQL